MTKVLELVTKTEYHNVENLKCFATIISSKDETARPEKRLITRNNKKIVNTIADFYRANKEIENLIKNGATLICLLNFNCKKNRLYLVSFDYEICQ